MAEVRYRRNIAGERYVTRSPFGPVGRDTRRRTVLVNLDARRRAPLGKGKEPDQWQAGYPPGRLKRSVRSDVGTDSFGDLVGTVTADARRPGTITSYAMSVHEGSKAHVIVPRNRSRQLRFPGRDGRDVFSRGVIHPGNRRPNRFLRDALEAARG